MDALLPPYYRSLLEIQPGFEVRPDPSRRLPAVLNHLIKPARLARMTEEVSRLSPKVLEGRLKLLHFCFEGIQDVEAHLLEIFRRYFRDESPLNGCSPFVKIVAAAAIVQAYPYEGLACFNPTLVPDPDQDGVREGAMKVVVAHRSYGEYHRSAISFRTGIIDSQGDLRLDEAEKTPARTTLTCLPEVEGSRFVFRGKVNLNNAVLFGPFMVEPEETWEDLRITPFVDEGEYGGAFLGTFTSFNFMKRKLQPSVLITRDFKAFDYHLLRGSGAEDKDLAFFPRKIKGRYAMLSRNDGRDLFLMTSDDLLSYGRKKKIAACRPESFDAHKMGVCAPPLETPAGWLVIYHGVADPGQIYSLSALLLDLEDPSKVKARLPYTLHFPLVDEQVGMLTHINYTCGAVVHPSTGTLVMPFACNDSYWKVGRIGMDELMARLRDDGRKT